MARGNIIVGLDVGSSNIRSVIAESAALEQMPRVIGVGNVPASGIRRGVVVDIDEVAKAINESLEMAEKMAGVAVQSVTASLGGSQVYTQSSKGVVAIGRADGEVTSDDVHRAVEAAQAISVPLNREIIHIIPKSYRLDDQSGIKDPLGMSGVRLEVDSLIVEGATAQVKNLAKCIKQAEVEINEMVLSPLAASKAVLSKKQKELGVVMIDIGGGTTSLAVFEEGDLLHTAILPIGSSHVTNDIAIGLRTSIDVAEKVKLEFGDALSREADNREEIDLSQLDSREEGAVLLHHVAEIIEARFEEIFNLINKELKNIGKAGLLPAGVVLTGGGAKMPHLVELAKEILGLPVQVGFPTRLGGILDKVDDSEFATAVGLVLWSQDQYARDQRESGSGGVINSFSRNAGDTFDKIKKIMGKFLP